MLGYFAAGSKLRMVDGGVVGTTGRRNGNPDET
jgi:hypothetical protein